MQSELITAFVGIVMLVNGVLHLYWFTRKFGILYPTGKLLRKPSSTDRFGTLFFGILFTAVGDVLLLNVFGVVENWW